MSDYKLHDGTAIIHYDVGTWSYFLIIYVVFYNHNVSYILGNSFLVTSATIDSFTLFA